MLSMAVLSLCAGLVLGWAWTPLARIPAAAPQAHGGPRPWFDQLQLRADQQKQMDVIWGDTGAQMQKLFEKRRELERQRDEQIAELLSPSELAAYDKIIQEFHSAREEMDKQRDAILADANARSRALLDDSQKQTWDLLSKDIRRHRVMHGPTTNASTMPSEYQGGRRD